MSEYEKASKGSYYLFLSQMVAIIGGLVALILFSAYIGANVLGLAKNANVSTSISAGFNFTSLNAGSVLSQMPVSLLNSVINAVIVLIVAGAVVGFVEFTLMLYGWKVLSEFNSSEYHTPYVGSVMSLIGFLLVVPPSAFMINAVKGAIVSYQLSQTVPAQILAEVLTASIPIFIGMLILLAGYIMVLIGYWRLGSQFNSTLIKAAIILLIISIVISIFSTILPLLPGILDIVSVILLTAGLYSVSKKTKLQGSSQTSL
ncbi:MAG: DUF973 family protein [Nitrososphaeria archaeon]|nr:DUF973 family protein [Conexivisphaerales archaeon]